MSYSVQLNETASAVANASGDVTLKFPIAKVNRTWQGTVSILNAPAGSQWTLSVGNQPFATVYAPGPAGPFQILSGQVLSLSATGLTAGDQYTAVLSGVDDPSTKATPYTGPTAVTSITLGYP